MNLYQFSPSKSSENVFFAIQRNKIKSVVGNCIKKK